MNPPDQAPNPATPSIALGAPSIPRSLRDGWVSRLHLFLIPLAALIAVLPLILNGPSSGHDFDFHLLSWMEAARQFAHGNLHPHWAFTAAYNAGEPRFVFYPPISWTLGAGIGLLLSHLPGVAEPAAWTATPILYTWLALTLSGFALYRFARLYASPNAALVAATLYLANPYMLFTAYERTAYAELLAAAVIPLLLQSILQRKVTVARIALPVALLWLTNAPAAVMGCYALAFLAAVRLVAEAYRKSSDRHSERSEESPHPLRFALKIFAGTALGLLLAAFYILPATLQRRFVQISMATSIDGLSISHNFLFAHMGTTPDDLLHDAVLRTASWIAVALIAATALALAAVFLLRNRAGTPHLDSGTEEPYSFPIFPLALLAVAIAFLLTPLSLILWRHAPQAPFLQFPWRLLAILAPVLALSIARVLTLISGAGCPIHSAFFAEWMGAKRSAIAAVVSLILAAALVLPAYHRFHQPYDPADTPAARLILFHSNHGTDPTDEYTPTTADNDALAPPTTSSPPRLPPYWLATTPTAPAPSASVGASAPDLDSGTRVAPSRNPGPAPTHLALTLTRAQFLIFNLRDYPAWRITRNGTPIQHPVLRDDGLVTLALPAGTSTLDVRYACLPSETAGDVLTLLALALFALSLRNSAKPAQLPTQSS